jgi:hypothetical protein
MASSKRADENGMRTRLRRWSPVINLNDFAHGRFRLILGKVES